MCKEHEPSDQFITNLNWQLLSEFRRESRFENAPAHRPGLSGKLRMWVIGLTCFTLGIVGTTATQAFRTSPRAEYVLANAESEVEVAQARVDSTRKILDWLRSDAAREYPLYFDPSQREREVVIAQERLEDALSEQELRKLELRESRVTHQPPRSEIWTPLVNGEDLLSKRLQLALKDQERKLQRLLQMADPGDPQAAGDSYTGNEIRLKIEALERSLQLRKQFLAGGMTKEQLVDLERLAEARQTVERINGVLESYHQIYEETKAKFDAGQVSPLTVSKWEIDLKHMEASLRLAQKEVELLSQGLQVDTN